MVSIPEGEAPLSYLAYTLPPRPEDVDGDAVLDRFLDYVRHQGLELYPAQEEAVLEIVGGRNVILNTPTGSGKSLVATALHFHALALQERSFYTAPIKALVNEKFFALCRDFGPENVGLMTGDGSVNRDAPILCCTAEILANIGLREGGEANVKHVVIDEFHYYSDRDRGVAWQTPLLTLPQARFLLMSATFGDAHTFEERLTRLNGLPTAVVRSTDRPVPLDFEYSTKPLHETLLELVRSGKAPVYVVNFTQRACAEEAQNLMSQDYTTKEEKKAIQEALKGARFDSAYGKDVARFLRHGIGIHHAGLLPKYRLLVEKLAQRGHLKIVVGTDTLGVGVNIPIRTVLFTKLCKYDGNKTALLSARDFHQIAGRAGRRGFDTQGSVVVQAPEHVIENLRMETRAAGDAKKLKKLVRKKPPERGYIPWDEKVFEKLVGSLPEPLESRFQVSHGMLVNVLQRGDGCRAMARLIWNSHEPKRRKRQHARTAADMFQSLVAAGLIEIEGRSAYFRGDLQEDFSLHQTLSLFLVEALSVLDPEAEDYGLDVLTFVESILENPEIILLRQVDLLKTRKLAELKAAGVEYEERMAELEKIDYPRPKAELIYEVFNVFAKAHPWVAAENVRPKAIAREMYEGFLSFSDYIREYGLERSEGLLLRYLSDVYKTLTQTVPVAVRSDAVEDIITYFRALLASVDSSLIDEWERLVARGAPDTASPETALVEADRVDVTRDARGFEVLIRNRLFSLLRALERRDADAALALLEPGEETWSAQRFEAVLTPYFAEHQSIRLDPAARSPKNTRILSKDGRYWPVQQVITDPEDDNDWALFGRIDVDRSREAGHPVFLLDRIGT
jgi:superfamily II RNA helicase